MTHEEMIWVNLFYHISKGDDDDDNNDDDYVDGNANDDDENDEDDDKQVRIHEGTVACDWAGAVMPENHEINGILDIGQFMKICHFWKLWTFLKILNIFGHFWTSWTFRTA